MKADEEIRARRHAGQGASWLVAGRLAVAVSGLVQVPMVYRRLDPDAFGLWIALTGLFWSLTFLDGGMGFAVQNRITRSLANGQPEEAARLARWTLRRLGTAAIMLMAAGVLSAACFPWEAWLGHDISPATYAVRSSIAVIFIAASLNIPLGLSARIVVARHEAHVLGASTCLAAALSLLAFGLADRNGGSLVLFTAASCVLPVSTGTVIWWRLRRTPWWRTSTAARPEVSGLVRESGLFLAPMVGAAAIGVFVPTLMSMTCGAAVAGTFGVLQRIYGLILQLHANAMMPAWPAFSDAAARGDSDVAARTMARTWRITLVGFALPIVIITPAIPLILDWWLGANAPVITPTLLWAMAAWHLLQLAGQNLAVILNGTGRTEWSAALGLAMAASATSLGFWIGPLYGPLGIIAALAVPYLAINLPISLWQARIALRAKK
jgi:O-antigen/teichoic acid export membrane protein